MAACPERSGGGCLSADREARGILPGSSAPGRRSARRLQAAVGSAESLPLGNKRRKNTFTIEGRAAESERVPVAEVASVSSGYFEVLKTPLRKGRVFTEHDNSTGQRGAVST